MSKASYETENEFWQGEYGSIYHYLEKSSPYQKLVEDTIDFLKVSSGDKILDLGCGSGALIRKLWQKTENKIGEIVGLDFAQVQLDIAKKKLEDVVPLEHRKRFNFVLHDLRRKLSFADDYFDNVVAGLVVTYIYEHEEKRGKAAISALLAEIKRVLKPGGYLVWSTPIKNVQFLKVFLASWRDILDFRDPKRLIMGPKILRHALTIQKKGKEEFYNFLDINESKNIHNKLRFEIIGFKYSFAGQALVQCVRKSFN